MTALLEAPTRFTSSGVTFLELEITRECQLTCASHCYAQAGPGAGHGTMTVDDWQRVMADAARYGVTKVQLIGGEPTRHPAFAELLRHGLNCGLKVEVFSNLFRIRDEWWELLSDSRVSLATSYYSDDPAEHDAITGRPGSHAKTRANIAEVVRRGIALRAGVIHMHDGQRSQQARAELTELGVARVSVDRVRGIGNAVQNVSAACVSELCGSCGRGIAAVGPDGQVWPCVMSRFLHSAGNVKTTPLADILGGEVMAALVSAIPAPRNAGCVPDSCTPREDSCQPSPGTAGSGAQATAAEDCVPKQYMPREDSCQPFPSAANPCVPKDSPCQPGKPACLPKFSQHHPEVL
jgi:MoaA/NifB/PqqE/SkfB family radical SAM enzyme